MARTGRPKGPRETFQCGYPDCTKQVERTRLQISKSETLTFFCPDHRTGVGRPRLGEWRQCPICPKKFWNKLSEDRVACSRSHAAKVRGYTGKRLEAKICPWCDKSFQPKTQSQQTCLKPACVSWARSGEKVKWRCAYADCPDPEQETRPSRVQEYCGRDCRTADHRVMLICQWEKCPRNGEPFSCTKAASKTRKYCGDPCRWAARRTNAIEREHNGKPVVRIYSISANVKKCYLMLWQPDHPRANVNGWVLEHVYEACLKYGRIIPLSEHVHHVDRDGENNAWENLVVLSHEDHARLTAMENAQRAAEADSLLVTLAERDQEILELKRQLAER